MTTLLYDDFHIHICESEFEFPDEIGYNDIYIAGNESDCQSDLDCKDCLFNLRGNCKAELSYLPNLFPSILDTNPELFI